MRRRRTAWCWLTVAVVALTACRHGDEPPSSTYRVGDGSIVAVADPDEIAFDDVAHLPGTGLMQVATSTPDRDLVAWQYAYEPLEIECPGEEPLEFEHGWFARRIALSENDVEWPEDFIEDAAFAMMSADDGEALFDRVVGTLAACAELEDGERVTQTLLTREQEPVEDLGDEAVRFQVVYSVPFIPTLGYLTVVRDGDRVLIGLHGLLSNRTDLDAPTSFDPDDPVLWQAIEELMGPELVADVVRAHEAWLRGRRDSLRVDRVEVVDREWSDLAVFHVSNDGAEPVTAIALDVPSGEIRAGIPIAVGSEGLLAVSVREPTEIGVFALSELAGVEYSVTVEQAPSIGGRVRGVVETQGLDRPPALALLFSDEEGRTLDYLEIDIESFELSTDWEPSEPFPPPPYEYRFDLEVPDVPGATTVELVGG